VPNAAGVVNSPCVIEAGATRLQAEAVDGAQRRTLVAGLVLLRVVPRQAANFPGWLAGRRTEAAQPAVAPRAARRRCPPRVIRKRLRRNGTPRLRNGRVPALRLYAVQLQCGVC